MILYIAGPISSDMEDYKLKFNSAESYLSCWKGHIVLNPASHPIGLKYEDYMKIDFAMIDAADGIVALLGWRDSPGAKREVGYALRNGKKIFYGIEAVPICKDGV